MGPCNSPLEKTRQLWSEMLEQRSRGLQNEDNAKRRNITYNTYIVTVRINKIGLVIV